MPDLTSGTQTNNAWLDGVIDADHEDGSNTGIISTLALKSVYGVLKGLIFAGGAEVGSLGGG